MAFWKKSEDPWDIDPAKKRSKAESTFEKPAEPEKEREDGFLSGLFGKKEEEDPETPTPCPYCGKVMEKGYLFGGNLVQWSKEKPSAVFGTMFMEAVTVSDEGTLTSYKTCHLCEDCRKLIVDIPEHTGPNYVWENGEVKLPEDKEEEAHDL